MLFSQILCIVVTLLNIYIVDKIQPIMEWSLFKTITVSEVIKTFEQILYFL